MTPITSQLTPLVLTYNEGPNIGRALAKLTWAQDILLVDSFSTDETLIRAGEFPQVRIVQRKFDSFADQCNFGLTQIATPWVLSLDADYILSDELVEEIKSLKPTDATAGYSARFRYCIEGRPLRGSLYPARTVLYRRGAAQYRNDGHGHRVHVGDNVVQFKSWIDHDDRKPLERWLSEQGRYARLEARHLMSTDRANLNAADRIRRLACVAPVLVFCYTLISKRLILDGWPGWYYVFQRTLAELILSLRLVEARLQSGKGQEQGAKGPGGSAR